MDDNAHTGCYIFQPTAREEEEDIDPRPSKKRKLTKTPSKSVEDYGIWPRLLGGQEPDEAATLREKLFKSTWAKQQAKLDQIAHPFDEQLIDEILESRCHTHADHLQGQKNLRTYLLVSPPGAQYEFQKLWDRKLRSNDQAEIVLHLQPAQCPNIQTTLKNIIKSAIAGHGGVDEYSDFLTTHKALIPMNFDLELLQRYVQSRDVNRVLISLMEIEAFDTAILSELTSTLHSWSDRIPIVLFIGISTTVELFEARLSRATVSLLDALVFNTSPVRGGGDLLFKVYETLRLDEETGIFIGPAIIDILAELAEDQNTTPDTIARAIKYVYMTHFFANPLSLLLSPSDSSPPWNTALYQTIRNVPSFKPYCEALSKGDELQRQKARQLVTSDEILETEVKEAIDSGREVMRSSFFAIYAIRYIYHHVLQLDKYSPWESEVQLLSSLPDLIDTEIFEAITDAAASYTRASDSSIMQVLNESSEPGLAAFKNYCSSQSSPDPDSDDVDAEENTTATTTTLITTLLRSYLEEVSSTTTSYPLSLSLSHNRPINPFRHFMAESYTTLSKSPLSHILQPRSRYGIERALTRPADYLGCDCCSPSPAGVGTHKKDAAVVSDKSTFPPTSLLLSMLNEAGSVINVRDLWDAFRDTLEAAERDAEEDDHDHEDHDQDEDQMHNDRHMLALFYRSLAELRYLGLLKQSKRKPPGVECVQKTAWMGL